MKFLDGNDRVLVTGATGFIGGRLVEFLAARGVRIRVATSDFRNCARVARFPVEIVKADIGDPDALYQATVGCDVVFHAAYRWGNPEEHAVNLDGARSLAEAFLKNGGRRFIHVSSVAAYGNSHDGELTEETPQNPTGEPYSDTKSKIETFLLGLHRTRGLPVTIIQPTIVYGPYGRIWTTNLLEQVRSMRVALPNGGLGLCNAVYVDDVVSALVLAAERDTAVGEAFLISGFSPITWREFYGAYESMAGNNAVIHLDDSEMQLEERRQRKSRSVIQRLRRALAERPEFRQHLLNLPPQRWILKEARRLLPTAARAAAERRYESLWRIPVSGQEPPIFVASGLLREIYTSRARVRIDKAVDKLGYNPAFSLQEGMARTAEWAKWANLLAT